MTKVKALIVACFLLFSAPLIAKDFDWSECWCNYGAGIEQGDMTLSIAGGIAPLYWRYGGNYWSAPSAVVDFQVVQPIWKLPFSFGGYLGYRIYGYDCEKYNWVCNDLFSGGTVSYHVMLPPKNLDVYASTRIGFLVSFYHTSDDSVSREGRPFDMDIGEVLGASWYFNDTVGLNLELGYPMSKFGVVFKF